MVILQPVKKKKDLLFSPKTTAPIADGTKSTIDSMGELKVYNALRKPTLKDEAKSINQSSIDMAKSVNAGDTTPPPAFVSPPAQPTKRDEAFKTFWDAIAPKNTEQIDALQGQVNQLDNYSNETAYTSLRKDAGLDTLEKQLSDTNQMIQDENRGLRDTREQIFNSSGGVTDVGIQQLRSANSRDFIRNLSDLSDIQSATIDTINTKNASIDKVLELRRQDRESQKSNLEKRIELLKNSISPEQYDLLKMQLEDKLSRVDKEEQDMAETIKQKNEYYMKVGDINSENPVLQDIAIRNGIDQLYTQYPIAGMESASLKYDKVKWLIAGGMNAQDALKQIEGEIRNSDRFKNYTDAYNRSLAPEPTSNYDFIELEDGTIARTNKESWEVTFENYPGTGENITANTSVQTDPQGIISYAIDKQVKRGKIKSWETKIQCWQLTNSYIEKITWTYWTAWDSLESKNKDLERLWISDVPVVWGLYTWDVGTKEWHIGIVQSINVNEITVLEANKEGKKEWWEPVVGKYTINDKMKFSQAPSVDEIKTANLPSYRAYMEDGKMPSKDALKGMWMTSQQFMDKAEAGYDKFLKQKEQEISNTYPTLNIQFTPSYSTMSAIQREKLNESLTKIGDIDQRIQQFKKLFIENGTEVLPTKARSEMETLRQQIILKWKEVENLWVLNWPDLWILESLLPSTTGIKSGLWSIDKNTLTKIESIQNNYRSDAQTKGINYGARITFKGTTTWDTWSTVDAFIKSKWISGAGTLDTTDQNEIDSQWWG